MDRGQRSQTTSLVYGQTRPATAPLSASFSRERSEGWIPNLTDRRWDMGETRGAGTGEHKPGQYTRRLPLE